MKQRYFPAVMLCLFLAGCNGLDNDRPNDGQVALEQVSCWFDPPASDPVTLCYFLHVPQDYDDPDETWIRFPVVILKSANSQGGKTPVLHLGGGGPGNPLGFLPGADVSWVWELYQGMATRRGRDLVMIDPRGVGHSSPALNCPEYVSLAEDLLAGQLNPTDESRLTRDAYLQCRNRLEDAGVDFSFYNSAMVARDMEHLRLALGVEQWNLYGVSYGSRYAQTMVRDFPGTVESMVLDAATFPDVAYTERSGDAYLQSLERLFEYCEGESHCSQSLGDVRGAFWALVESLETAPPDFVMGHPYRPYEIDIRLTGMRFLNAYYNALYDAGYYAGLPDVISALEQGEIGLFNDALVEWIYFILDDGYADAAAIAHYCYEEWPFVDLTRAEENLEVLPPLLREVARVELHATADQCREWGVAAGQAIEGRPVQTDVPTLFLHGALDPVLPVEDLDLHTRTFTRSEQVVFSDVSHSVVGVHHCGIELAAAFFDFKTDFLAHVQCLE